MSTPQQPLKPGDPGFWEEQRRKFDEHKTK